MTRIEQISADRFLIRANSFDPRHPHAILLLLLFRLLLGGLSLRIGHTHYS